METKLPGQLQQLPEEFAWKLKLSMLYHNSRTANAKIRLSKMAFSGILSGNKCNRNWDRSLISSFNFPQVIPLKFPPAI